MGKNKSSKNSKEDNSRKKHEEKEIISMTSSENQNHNAKKQSLGENTKR